MCYITIIKLIQKKIIGKINLLKYYNFFIKFFGVLDRGRKKYRSKKSSINNEFQLLEKL
jgi:hypothetical protein